MNYREKLFEDKLKEIRKALNEDKKIARQCLLYRGTPNCSNNDCKNFTCPLNRKRGYEQVIG